MFGHVGNQNLGDEALIAAVMQQMGRDGIARIADRAGVAVGVPPEARLEVARPAGGVRRALGFLGWFAVRQPLGAAGTLIVLVLVLTAVFAPQLAPYGPKDAHFAQYVAPSAEFPMGTDHLGRDIPTGMCCCSLPVTMSRANTLTRPVGDQSTAPGSGGEPRSVRMAPPG